MVGFVLQLGHPTGELFEHGGSGFAVLGALLAVPLAAAMRFLGYIDLRTRKEGWDIQLRFVALAEQSALGPKARGVIACAPLLVLACVAATATRRRRRRPDGGTAAARRLPATRAAALPREPLPAQGRPAPGQAGVRAALSLLHESRRTR